MGKKRKKDTKSAKSGISFCLGRHGMLYTYLRAM
jgi:hypothetical protein